MYSSNVDCSFTNHILRTKNAKKCIKLNSFFEFYGGILHEGPISCVMGGGGVGGWVGAHYSTDQYASNEPFPFLTPFKLKLELFL